MPDAYEPGAFYPASYLPSTVTPIYGIALNSYVNRTPLFTRLPMAPLGAPSFKTSTVLFRPSTYTLSTALTDTTGTAVVLTDASAIQTSDVIEIDNEDFIVTAVNISTNTLTVVRGYASSTAATHLVTATVYLISNTRTGGDVNQTGISRIPTALVQWAQVHQFPWHVGGSMASNTAFALPPGVQSVVGRERMMAIQNCSDDCERAYYYGKVVPIVSDGDKPMQAGLRSLIVTNHPTSPTNYATYMPTDLIRDTITPIVQAGGNPTTFICGSQWQGGLAHWGFPILRLVDTEKTKYGINIDTFECPFVAGMRMVFAPLLRPYHIICLSGGEVRQRIKRLMFDKPRGSSGDADQGDVIHEGAIELDNESHHAFVEGVTGWAPQS